MPSSSNAPIPKKPKSNSKVSSIAADSRAELLRKITRRPAQLSPDQLPSEWPIFPPSTNPFSPNVASDSPAYSHLIASKPVSQPVANALPVAIEGAPSSLMQDQASPQPPRPQSLVEVSPNMNWHHHLRLVRSRVKGLNLSHWLMLTLLSSSLLISQQIQTLATAADREVIQQSVRARQELPGLLQRRDQCRRESMLLQESTRNMEQVLASAKAELTEVQQTLQRTITIKDGRHRYFRANQVYSPHLALGSVQYPGTWVELSSQP